MKSRDPGPPGPTPLPATGADAPRPQRPARLARAWFDGGGRLHLELVIPCNPPEPVTAELPRARPPGGPLDLAARAEA